MRDVIINPVFKDVCTFIKTSVQTNGEYSELEVVLGSKGKNPHHRHSAFTETFTALEGRLGISLNGKDLFLKPNETITVQFRDSHRFFNPDNTPCRFRIVFRPGHTGMENMLRILYGLAADGKTNLKGVPDDITTIAILSEMGNTELTGLLSLLSPLMKWLANKGRNAGVERQLVETYCKRIVDLALQQA